MGAEADCGITGIAEGTWIKWDWYTVSVTIENSYVDLTCKVYAENPGAAVSTVKSFVEESRTQTGDVVVTNTD